MVHLYKELQPADHFEISLPQSLSTQERQLLTLFYQPLTGPEPISLYLTLWAEAEDATSSSMSHYYLMSVLNMPIGKIFEARIALEAIGLLRTFRKQEEENRSFIYELIRPLDAYTFFQDPLLSMFLFSKIGEQAYRKLRKRFVKSVTTNGFKDVSRTFTDVYKPVHSKINMEQMDNQPTSTIPYPFYMEEFDFNLLKSGLSEQLVPSKTLTLEIREVIAKLAYLYRFNPLDMQQVVILALDDEMNLSRERLKKAAADVYKLTISNEPPQLQKFFSTEIDENRIVEKTVKSKEEEMIEYFESTNPIEHLRNLNNGKEPTDYTKELVSNLFINHGMNIGVVNVLIEYVMLQTDKKLPKNFVETIADHWNRKNIKTAKEAMAIARSEHDKFKKIKNKEYIPKVSEVELEKQNVSNTNTRTAKYERTIPYEFLKQLNNGREPFPYTIELAESLVNNYSMPIGVVNVLMEYAFEQTDGKVTRRFVETIASNWMKIGIDTAEDALNQIDKTIKNKEFLRTTGFIPTITRETIKKDITEVDGIYYFYETTPPYEFMKDLNNGSEPFPTNVKIAEDLINKFDLPLGVVNVLSEYVLSRQGGKFSKRYVETIANTLRQAGIQTAKEAFDYLSKTKEELEMKSKLGYVPQITQEQIQSADNDGEHYYSAKTPYEFLKQLSNGTEPNASNVKLAESLVLNNGLSIGVANVLIEYVYNIKSGQLPKKYVETIASNWIHQNIRTVQQAKAVLHNKEAANEMLRNVGYVPTITETELQQMIGNRDIEEQFKEYEMTTPYEFLKKLNHGVEPYANNIQLAEKLVHRYKLPVGVTNVLIEYVLEIKDGKLPRAYVETIADSWSRKNFVTAKDAAEHVAMEKENYAKRQEEQENRPRSKWGRVEQIPDWFKERNEQIPSNDSSQQPDSIDFEKERLRILEKLGRKE
ncbi:replicative DNA helicase loader DnaB [Ureibacillus xyleni]|uniref:Replicative DNA helicase loader DnaB n=1 Tax=Ureibacillus xyleni TaxID=614648 RepID=A0A285S6S4_9BACL|nr:DnaD domain protein [Ureibacillus xyleni]SOC03132.1 replicative DNA helicase loader DnaB [Ureibacillus xyleni]